MVERTNPMEGKKISVQKLKSLNSVHCRILTRLIPDPGEDFPKYNSAYISKVLGIHQSYIDELLEFLYEKNVISFDGESYFLTQDSIYMISEFIDIQPAIILRKKLEEFEG